MNRPKLHGVLGLVFLITLMVAQAAAQAITVSGQVKGKGGDPKVFVSVQVAGPERYNAITDPKGNFTIRDVRPGQYLITVTEGNYFQKFNTNIDPGNHVLQLIVGW